MENAGEGKPTQTPASKPKKPSYWRRFIHYVEARWNERKTKNNQQNSQERAAARTATATLWIAGFTFVLAGAAIYQFVVLGRQLDTMRKDQRPWIRVDSQSSFIQVNSAVFAVIRLLNKGKTPARGVYGDLFVEMVKNGEEPQFDSPQRHERIREGIQFPDIASDPIPINRLLSLKAGQGDLEPLTDIEFKNWSGGKTYFAVYGTIHYGDYYNVQHWTRFCFPLVAPPASGETQPRFVTFLKCTNYGDVDGN